MEFHGFEQNYRYTYDIQGQKVYFHRIIVGARGFQQTHVHRKMCYHRGRCETWNLDRSQSHRGSQERSTSRFPGTRVSSYFTLIFSFRLIFSFFYLFALFPRFTSLGKPIDDSRRIENHCFDFALFAIAIPTAVRRARTIVHSAQRSRILIIKDNPALIRSD